VLRADQRRRWQRGQKVEAELYFQDFPTLAADERAAADLVFHEYCLREEIGPAPTLDDFRTRFPQLVSKLEKRLVVHQLLREKEGVSGGTASTDFLADDDEFPKVPGYFFFRELGRGGMGVVYQANQEGLDRFVALKMLLPEAQADEEDRLRFKTEMAVVSRLQHPNLIQIYEVGEFEGRPFFSMEFVDGGSLEDKLKGQPMAPKEAAKIAAVLARAMHYAHRHNIVHRDLKPANVLLTADGLLKITDFGVAKRQDRGGKPAQEMVLGTPIYMAPEQARAKAEEIGPHTDVYALGAMVYEFLTAAPPFMGETVQDTLLKVLYEELVPPSRLQARIPRALEAIVVKCLEKEPAKRYATAEALAIDLEKFLTDEGEQKSGSGWLTRWLKG
jgi:serine/threonine protein kinase